MYIHMCTHTHTYTRTHTHLHIYTWMCGWVGGWIFVWSKCARTRTRSHTHLPQQTQTHNYGFPNFSKKIDLQRCRGRRKWSFTPPAKPQVERKIGKYVKPSWFGRDLVTCDSTGLNLRHRAPGVLGCGSPTHTNDCNVCNIMLNKCA